MRTRRKAFSLLLAFAMLVTSVSGDWAATVRAAGSGESAEKTPLLTWDADYIMEENGDERTEDGTVWKDKTTFKEKSIHPYSLSVDTYNMVLSRPNILKALGKSSSLSVSSPSYSYQWSKIGTDGKVEETFPEDSSYLYLDEPISNAEDEAVYRCEVKLESVWIDGSTYELNDVDTEQYPIQITKDFVYCYDGPTAEKVEAGKVSLEDYFSIDEDSVKDMTVDMAVDGDSYADLTAMDISVNDYDGGSLDVKWQREYEDGTSDIVEDWGQTGASSVYSHSIYEYKYDDKLIQSYVCTVDLKYGDRILKTYRRTYTLKINVFKVLEPTSPVTEVSARLDAKKTFTVRAEYPEEYCKGLAYQWYEVDKAGKAIQLKDETADTLKKKITDTDMSYKCVVRSIMRPAYAGIEDVKEYTFQIKKIPGLLVRSISDRVQSAGIGESVDLFIDASVDEKAGYKLSYSWYCLQENTNGKVERVKMGSDSPRLTITPQSEEDFEVLTDPETDNDYKYGLIVSVKDDKDKEVVSQSYRFSIYEDMGIEYSTNATEGYGEQIQVYYGDPVDLYVKDTKKDNYTVEKTWYKEVGTQRFRTVYDYETGKEEVEYLDSDFQAPAGSDYTYYDEYDYDEDYDDYGNVRHFMRKVPNGISADGSTCTVSGKENIPGKYICQACVFSSSNLLTEKTMQTFEFTLTAISDLTAHAKTSEVTVSVGAKADMEVVAGNFDPEKCPISYQWEKYNEDKETYEKIAGAKTAKYTIAGTKKEDFGSYRVVVSDAAESKNVSFTLREEEMKVISYSPDFSEYTASIGDVVKLDADVALPEGVTSFYAWYRSTDGYVEAADYDQDDYWEILNQDTKEYAVPVKSEDDFRQYKCVLSYKENNTYVEKSFVYSIVHNEFSVEPLTPRTQYKQIGSKAVYTARAVAADETVSDSQFTYQWYRGSWNYTEKDKIEGATQSTYTIDKLTAQDFAPVTCVVTMKDGASKSVTFYTYLGINAYLEKYSEEIEVSVGEDVTMEPTILKGEGYNFTYQWYRRGEDEDEDEDEDDEIIHGATEKAYNIQSLGKDEINRSYYCEVYVDEANVFTYTVSLTEKEEEQGIELKAKDDRTEQDAVIGKSAELEVEARSLTGIDLKYQWYFSTHGEDFTAIGGAVSAVYKLDKVIEKNFGYYKCIVTDAEGRTASVSIRLRQTTDLTVTYDTLYTSDYVGYETTLGSALSLKVKAQIDPSYQVFYEWSKQEEPGTWRKLLGEESDSLNFTSIKAEDLGKYFCRVYDSTGSDHYNVYFQVYVDTGLKIVQNCQNVIVQKDGSAAMVLTATANQGETISYQWYKKTFLDADEQDEKDELLEKAEKDGGDEEENVPTKWEEIENATEASYRFQSITKADYGEYSCRVSTSGEEYMYYFDLKPSYQIDVNREYVEQGGDVTAAVNVENPASDIQYTYEWYAEDPVTGAMMKMGQTTPSMTAKAPKVNITKNGYKDINYTCVICDGEEEISVKRISVSVLPILDYSSSRLPESDHPNSREYDVQAYRIPGAEKLKIEFDTLTDLGNASLYVINSKGKGLPYLYDEDEEESPKVMYVTGDTAIFLMNGNTKADSYGYKVSSITKVEKPQSTEKPKAQATQASQESQSTTSKDTTASKNKKKVPKKGTKKTVKNVTYKVTKSSAKKGTAAVASVKSKKLKSVTIAKTVKINGYTFKVTSIAKNAFKGCKKLKKITVKTTTLKSVGKAFQKVPKKAVAKVPAKKKKSYKKLFKKAGFKGKVK